MSAAIPHLAQHQLDTRAIELAQKAVTLIEIHERECARERTLIAGALGEIKASLNGMWSRLWVAACGVIGLLLVIVGYLINKHGI